MYSNQNPSEQNNINNARKSDDSKRKVLVVSPSDIINEKEETHQPKNHHVTSDDHHHQIDSSQNVKRVDSFSNNMRNNDDDHNEHHALEAKFPSSIQLGSAALQLRRKHEISAVTVDSSGADSDHDHENNSQHQHVHFDSPIPQKQEKRKKHKIRNSANSNGEGDNLSKIRKRRRSGRQASFLMFPFSSSTTDYHQQETSEQLQQQQQQQQEMQNDEFISFLEDFPQESQFDQLKNLRMHFVSAKHAAARLHTTLQAVQVLPPDENFLIQGLENLFPASTTPTTRNKKVSQEEEEEESSPRDETEQTPSSSNGFIQLANEIFSPEMKFPARKDEQITDNSNQFSPSSRSKNFLTPQRGDADDDDQESSPTSFFGGRAGSPVHRRVFDKDQRLDFDIWMQQEIEFTQLCFFKVEDVFRCRLMKWRREAIEQAREFTFDCLLDDCLEGEFFARLDMYRDEEASTMELFTQVELMRLVARREDYMLRLSCVKCYLRVWSGIVDDKRDVMLEEDREWELMMKMNQRDIRTIVKRPLARFWIRTDSEHQKVEDEMEQMMAGMQNKISSSINNNEDSNNVPRSLFARRPTKIPDVCQSIDDTKNVAPSKIISFIPNHDLNKHQTILKSQQDHVYALERRARAQIAEERDHDAWFEIFSVGIEREEFLLFRKQLQDQIWLEGVRTRQQFVREHQKLLIFAQEHFLRTKWSAMENTQWRTLKNGEAADWSQVMNRASLAYHVTGFLLARSSVQYLLREKAGRVISLFLKQRRAVLRIQNMRKNLARFFQRCGRGYLTRTVCCEERLQMLKCKKEELDKLKLQLSVLMSRFLRARFSRGSVGLARATREVTRFVNWRKAAIETRRRYNQQVVLPHAKIILAFLYFWYSSKRIVHDEKRLNHCATILQKNMWSLAQRMKTSRVVMVKSRFLNFVKSRNLVVDKKYRWSLNVLKLFATNAIENQRKAREYAMTKLKLTFCLQRIGRGSICRNSELRPSHLYKVQEKLYSVSKIKNWWRRIKMIETERNGEGENDLYYHLRLLKRNKNLDEDFLVDLLVLRKAATMIQSWWRMTISRKKYSAWKISNFFVRHRLRIEHAFMKKIKYLQPKRQIKAVSNNNNNDESNCGIFVVGGEENPRLTSENNKDSFCYIVGTEKERSSNASISLSADVADDLEEEFYVLYAKIVESFVETMKKVKILFTFETHEARHREFERRLSSLTKQETAVRTRIEFSNFNKWWPAFLRMIAHCKVEFANEVHALYRQANNQDNENIVPPPFLMTSSFNYNYFIPLAKRKEMMEQQLSDNEQDEKRKTILRGFKIPDDDLLLIKQQRARMRFLKSLKEKQDDSEIFLQEEHSYSALEDENEQVAEEEEEQSKDVVSHQHLLEEAESSAQFLESSTDRIIQLIRKKRQAKEQEEKKRRPLSAMLLPTKNNNSKKSDNNSNVIASSRDWLRKYQQEKANRPASASAPNKQKYFAQADDDNDLILAEHDLEQINSQRNSAKLLPPTGRHFDLYTGVFDVCRWWGNQTMKAVAAKNKKERINNNNNNADKKTAAPATSLQFAGTTLEEVCQEVLRCKPIEVLAMASPWFPMNGGAIAAIVNTALVHNRKTLKQIHVLTKLDAEFVMRMLKRERLYPEKVAVYSYESDREKINDLSVCE